MPPKNHCDFTADILIRGGGGNALRYQQKTVYRLLDRGLLKASNALRHRMILSASVDEFIATNVK